MTLDFEIQLPLTIEGGFYRTLKHIHDFTMHQGREQMTN